MGKLQQKYGPWALITGASSGLGAIYAEQLAKEGMNLILVARRKARLDSNAKDLEKAYKIEVKTIESDLAKENFIDGILSETENLEVGLLVNNAGFGITSPFLENPLERELELQYVNCRAPLILAHHFGRKMVNRGCGGIIFVSSITAFIAAPIWFGYSSSKVYDLFMANALWGELKDKGVDVQAFCPGATKTEFGRISGIGSKGASMKPGPVVAESLRKLGKKSTVIAGTRNKILYVLIKVTPRAVVTLITGRLFASLQKKPEVITK